jgi:hypothetical protein
MLFCCELTPVQFVEVVKTSDQVYTALQAKQTADINGWIIFHKRKIMSCSRNNKGAYSSFCDSVDWVVRYVANII